MNERLAWRGCAVAGLAVAVAGGLFATIPDLALCGPASTADPVLALELAADPAMVAAMFGSEPCRGRLVAAQLQVLWIDAFALIPAYTAFLLFGFYALRRRIAGLATAGAASCLLAALLDEAEGVILLHVLGDLPGTPGLLDPLYWIVRAKFLLLGIAEVLLAILLLRDNWLGKLASVPTLAGAATGLGLLFTNPYNGAMLDAHLIAWAPLCAFAIVRGSGGAARDRSVPRGG